MCNHSQVAPFSQLFAPRPAPVGRIAEAPRRAAVKALSWTADEPEGPAKNTTRTRTSSRFHTIALSGILNRLIKHE